MTEKKRKREKQDSFVDENEQQTAAADGQPSKIMNVALEANPEEDYESLCANLNAIAQPLASKKLAKKVYKLMKKAKKEKSFLKQGVADVQRALRKGERGLVVLAGDVTPIDIYCHLPAVCEQLDVPYVFTPSRQHIGLAMNQRRSHVTVMVKRHENYGELYDECFEIMKNLVP
uniref:Ribosomal protein L7Ae/L30e/S12e/Gadd45 domain-containing protein n=1 Tax=Romanomermis culicivorax TaxID=13658 RepID=A0A915K037_ROMCU